MTEMFELCRVHDHYLPGEIGPRSFAHIPYNSFLLASGLIHYTPGETPDEIEAAKKDVQLSTIT